MFLLQIQLPKKFSIAAKHSEYADFYCC